MVERSAKSEWESSWRRRRGDEPRRSRAEKPRMRHSTAWRGVALIPFQHDDQAGLDSVPARQLPDSRPPGWRHATGIEIHPLSPFARPGPGQRSWSPGASGVTAPNVSPGSDTRGQRAAVTVTSTGSDGGRSRSSIAEPGMLRCSRDRTHGIHRVRDRLPGWTCSLDVGDAGRCSGPPAKEPDGTRLGFT